MRIIKRTALVAFWNKFPQAEVPLRKWLTVAESADWASVQDVRKIFPTADAAIVSSKNTVTVFNIGGNDFRLVVAIKYKWKIIYIRDFLTHAEYSKDSWKGRH
ncbi:MAG TPA: type II toxin-antitoxin system HigB family toxin [Humisphaera sp.]|nr:type II toxin-antitoxin system HigB family toxin [Humisphaera sp.]